MAYTNPVAYERFMGRGSTRLAPLFAAFAGLDEHNEISHEAVEVADLWGKSASGILRASQR